MANTSLTLIDHWEQFIKHEIATDRYGSASEVVRDALRHLEEHQQGLEALRSHLAEGEQQISRGEGIKDFSMDDLIQDLDGE